MNIVGLGAPGCKIAKSFKIYPQYKIFCIDSDKTYSDKSLLIKEQASHEDYEKNYKKLKGLASCTGPTTFIVCGSGKISGATLTILEQLKKNMISLIYIKADESQMAPEASLRHRATFGVLQEYARSTVLNKLYVVSNKNVEKVVDNISLSSYWSDINNLISNTYHMLNVFENTEPLLTTMAPTGVTTRIATLGVANFETGKEKLFYDLQHARSKKYFYGINQKSMADNTQLLHQIREHVASHADEQTHASFSIYNTDYDRNYVYSKHYASYLQEQNSE